MDLLPTLAILALGIHIGITIGLIVGGLEKRIEKLETNKKDGV